MKTSRTLYIPDYGELTVWIETVYRPVACHERISVAIPAEKQDRAKLVRNAIAEHFACSDVTVKVTDAKEGQ